MMINTTNTRSQESCQVNHTTTMERSIPHTAFVKNVKRSSKRIVMFQPTISVRQSIGCAITTEERSRSFYRKDELTTFSLEVKSIIRASSLSKELPHPGELAVDPALRGLEHYLCPVRVRNKLIVKRTLLKFQRYLKANPNKTSEEKIQYLASVSVKLTHWSKMVARETARLNSLQAHDGDYSIPISKPLVISQFPYLTKRVRRVSDDNEEVEEEAPAKRRRP
jgi:hypothetical protein